MRARYTQPIWLHRTLRPTPVQAAAAAETQTELAARVSTWRQKIQPMLDEQEAQPAFDIHTYGDCMLEELATVSAVAPEDPVQLQKSQVGLQPLDSGDLSCCRRALCVLSLQVPACSPAAKLPEGAGQEPLCAQCRCRGVTQ